jgi:hypothetical protein
MVLLLSLLCLLNSLEVQFEDLLLRIFLVEVLL